MYTVPASWLMAGLTVSRCCGNAHGADVLGRCDWRSAVNLLGNGMGGIPRSHA